MTSLGNPQLPDTEMDCASDKMGLAGHAAEWQKIGRCHLQAFRIGARTKRIRGKK